jgi:hypothetical protein
MVSTVEPHPNLLSMVFTILVPKDKTQTVLNCIRVTLMLLLINSLILFQFQTKFLTELIDIKIGFTIGYKRDCVRIHC